MDDDRLLAEVLADPSGVAPRLVYADALLERGDPRGELIQVQCALEELGPDEPRRAELERRAGDLLGLHETGWTRELRARCDMPYNPGQLTFRRGFIERAWLGAPDVAKTLPILRAATPLRDLQITARGTRAPLELVAELAELEAIAIHGTGTDPEVPRRFAHWPHRGKLRSLELDGGSEAARAVAATPALADLARLKLFGVASDGIAALAGAPHLATVRRLLLPHPRLGPGDVARLAAAPMLGALDELDLENARLDGAAARELLAAAPALRTLRLFGINQIGADGGRAIGALARLEVLDAEAAGLGVDGLRALADSPLAALRHLDLSRTELALASVDDLLAAIARPSLTRFACAASTIDGMAVSQIADAPGFAGLRELDLARNEFGDLGVIALARARGLPALESLDVSRTGCGVRALDALSAGPLGDRLRVLELAGNAIDDAGVRALLAPVGRTALPRLVNLDLGGGVLTADGVRTVVDAPIARQLEALAMTGLADGALDPLLAAELPELRTLVVDAFDDRAAAALAAAHGLPMLQHVVLTAPKLTDDGARVLAGARGLERITWLEVGAPEVTERGRARLQARFHHHVGVFSSTALHAIGTMSRRF